MRVIGGSARGRRLVGPSSEGTRPLSDRARESLFNILGPGIRGERVLDLFAGTGALGLEAISRGAKYADFVENRPGSLHALKANVAALRVREKTRIFKKDALSFAAGLEAGAYDLAFCDPPYESRMLDRLIETWMQTPFATVLVCEHAIDHPLPAGGITREMDDKTAITIYRAPELPGSAASLESAPDA